MKIARIILPGLIIWIVPFVLGFFFYDSEGNLAIDIFLFKTIMILALVALSSLLSIRYLKKSTDHTNSMIIIVGFVWLLIPILLDALILIPMAEMTGLDYTYQIGLRYLVIPIVLVSQLKTFSLKVKQS